MSRRLKLEAWLHARREAWRAAFVKGPITSFTFEFVSFGVKQAWASLFGGFWGTWPKPMQWLGLAVGFAGIVLLGALGFASNALLALAEQRLLKWQRP